MLIVWIYDHGAKKSRNAKNNGHSKLMNYWECFRVLEKTWNKTHCEEKNYLIEETYLLSI